jgi:hypothetical protein
MFEIEWRGDEAVAKERSSISQYKELGPVSESHKFGAFDDNGELKIVQLDDDAIVWETSFDSSSGNVLTLADRLIALSRENSLEVAIWPSNISGRVIIGDKLKGNGFFLPKKLELLVDVGQGLQVWKLRGGDKLLEPTSQVFCCHEDGIDEVRQQSSGAIVTVGSDLAVWGEPRHLTAERSKSGAKSLADLSVDVRSLDGSSNGACDSEIPTDAVGSFNTKSGYLAFAADDRLTFCAAQSGRISQVRVPGGDIEGMALDTDLPRAIVWSSVRELEPRKFYDVSMHGEARLLPITANQAIVSGALTPTGSFLVLLLASRYSTGDFHDFFIRVIDLATSDIVFDLDVDGGDVIAIDRYNFAYVCDRNGSIRQAMRIPKSIAESISLGHESAPLKCTSEGGNPAINCQPWTVP